MMDFGGFVIEIFAVLAAPFLLSLLSKNGKAIMLALICSVIAILLSVEDYWAVVPWTIGMMVAVVAIYIRFAELAPIEQSPQTADLPRPIGRIRSRFRRPDSGC